LIHFIPQFNPETHVWEDVKVRIDLESLFCYDASKAEEHSTAKDAWGRVKYKLSP